MGLSKTSYFSEAQNELAKLAKALGHPARIAIIEHLLKVNTCICNDLVQELPLAQATISQHLKELKNAGLIKGNIEGNALCYCLDDQNIKILQIFLEQLSKQSCINAKQNCC